MVQLLELSPIGGERPATIGRDASDGFVQTDVEPDARPIGADRRAILWIDERPSTGRDDAVAKWQDGAQRLAFERAKVGFTLLREDNGHTPSLSRLDRLIDVLNAPIEAAAKGPSDRRLTRPHEPDQINFVVLHAQMESSTSKNPGYETATAPAPVIVEGPLAPRAAIAKAIANR